MHYLLSSSLVVSLVLCLMTMTRDSTYQTSASCVVPCCCRRRRLLLLLFWLVRFGCWQFLFDLSLSASSRSRLERSLILTHGRPQAHPNSSRAHVRASLTPWSYPFDLTWAGLSPLTRLLERRLSLRATNERQMNPCAYPSGSGCLTCKWQGRPLKTDESIIKIVLIKLCAHVLRLSGSTAAAKLAHPS